MAYALVGTIGAVSVGSSGAAVTPVWGTSETRAANNLLLCWVAGGGSATLPSAPAGWSIAKQQAGTSCSASIFYKIAAGSDTAPTIALVTSTVLTVRLGEFSGGPTASPLGATGGVAATTSPQTATESSTALSAPELMVYCGSLFYSVSGTKTITPSLNNSRTLVDVNDGATGTVDHSDFGYAVNGTNGAADAYTLTFSIASITGMALAAANFKLPSLLLPRQARHRSPRYSARRGTPFRGRF